MLADLKYALRQLTKAPGFTTVAVLILALGIASNTSVFSVINGMLLQGLPVRQPKELVLLHGELGPALKDRLNAFPFAAFVQFQHRAKSLADLAAVRTTRRTLVATGFERTDAVPVMVSGVSGNYFSFFGVLPSLGRALSPLDDQIGAARPVAVISHSLWQRQFGSDPNVLGRTLTIDQRPVSIVGIAPAGFTGVEVGVGVDLWIPLNLYPIIDPKMEEDFSATSAIHGTWGLLILFGCTRPETSRSAISTELDVIFRGLMTDSGYSAKLVDSIGYTGINLLPGGSGYNPAGTQAAPLLHILMAIVAAVLLVACANVAGLMAVRASARHREFALRGALGAGRAILVRQLLVESLLLAALGGALGLLMAHWGIRILAGFLPGSAIFHLGLDAKALAFAAGVSIATGLVIGIIPALRFTGLDLNTVLRQHGATSAAGVGQRMNRLLVIAQIALSMCLLAGAGLFARTVQNLRQVDLGFNRSGLLMVTTYFEQGAGLPRYLQVSRDALGRIRALPGVQAATFSWGGGGFLDGSRYDYMNSFSSNGVERATGSAVPTFTEAWVGPDFFETVGIPVIAGRGINEADCFAALSSRPSSSFHAAVINQSCARRYFGAMSPLGREIRIPDDITARALKSKQGVFRVVGVVRDAKDTSLRDEGQSEAFFPCSDSGGTSNLFLQVRSGGDPLALVPAIKTVLKGADPYLAAPSISTMEELIDRSTQQEAIVAQTASGFSLFALFLAALGLYGLLACNVSQRTQEMGVRIALGATAGDLLSLILRQGLVLAAIGCVIGAAAATALERLIASRLYGVHAFDPLTFVATSAVLFLAALLACWLPARRATRVDPMVALRAE